MSPSACVASWQTLDPRRPEQVPLRCWWARPADGPPRAGVLVLPEVFGLNGWIRGVAERLAAVGYAALAVPLFARTAPDLELGYDPDALALGRSHKERTRTEALLADVGLAADWLRSQLPPEAAGAGLGCVGFCFGGHVALLAASLPAVAATVDFYGAGVASGRPGGGPPSLELVPTIGGTLLCICGREDPLIPAADVAAIETALAAANAARAAAAPARRPHRLEVLEGGHGFMCAARSDHHPASAAAGWSLLLDTFAQQLGPERHQAGG
ncbi:dienelactone hydrolase family protein [Cyanobium sp. Candia 9D4]|uniref:dienelactone hydrolase family protein n=1 Tax=Cyanobium sp. Candia 9D4 TaxID=2823707 RepID=UPI0020CF4128|nr:dienelactone hydrolase family protein [Cyanobium sp. Candia 9D4]